MSSKENQNAEEISWQLHARKIQVDSIVDNATTVLDAELYTGKFSVSEESAHVLHKGIFGGAVLLNEIIGDFNNGNSEILKWIKSTSQHNSFNYYLSLLKKNCSDTDNGLHEFALSTVSENFAHMMISHLGGHKNEPILESIENGWRDGVSNFLEEISSTTPLLFYRKRLIKSMPVIVSKTILGEELFYLKTKIPGVKAKYWYPKGKEDPSLNLVIEPFN